MDRAVSTLITDLKQRGMLDETLVICSGEFGRTPFREGRTAKSDVLGRDHFPDCYSLFMAGGGMKPGLSYGASDELGFRPVENKVHVHDLQATILHTLGFDHERLTHRFQGRDYRLTDVFGTVVKGLLA
jgi:arylsulfatase A-like enzyme